MSENRDEGGFFARWSRRKAEQRQGIETPEPAPVAPGPDAPQPTPGPGRKAEAVPAPVDAGTTPEPPPPPTLADAEALAPGEEVSRFLAPNVEPGVRNAALKKLFADPHYNVMDGLDTYIDDYSKPKPIPPEMLRQMVQAKLLGLFADEEPRDVATPPAAPADTATPDIPAVAAPAPLEADNLASHEDADLRLQPDDAAGGVGPREGARPRKG